MSLIRKGAVPVLAALCAALMLTACGKGTKERPTIAEDDRPYGATMREDKKSYAVPMSYDRRFLDEEQIGKIADLYAAMQNSDAALYQGTTLPFYQRYQQEKVYGLESPEALIGHLHSMVADRSAEDFQYSMVVISDIAANPKAGTLRNVIEMLEDAYDGSGSFEDSLLESYDMTVEWHISYNDGAENLMVDNQHVFLFRTADGLFALV